MTLPLLTLKDVSYTPQETQVLFDINLEIHKGEIITIIGPNGGGKTSLLRLMLGLVDPTSGNITRKPNIRIGYTPQKLSLNQTMPITVQRFLELSPTPSRIDETLNIVEATNLKARSMHVLSGGETQRVMLARALLQSPELLVLDEPAQGLDVSGQVNLYKLIANLKVQLGCAIVLVSHDLHYVMGASNKVICLNKHICCAGLPENIANDPNYYDLFGQSILPYTHDHDHEHHPEHNNGDNADDN